MYYIIKQRVKFVKLWSKIITQEKPATEVDGPLQRTGSSKEVNQHNKSEGGLTYIH